MTEPLTRFATEGGPRRAHVRGDQGSNAHKKYNPNRVYLTFLFSVQVLVLTRGRAPRYKADEKISDLLARILFVPFFASVTIFS